MRMASIVMSLVFVLLVGILPGCGSGDNLSEKTDGPAATKAPAAPAVPDAPATPAAPADGPVTPALSDTIVLPAGWTIQQAITLEEMGKIIGKEMAFYHDNLDKPAEGKPKGGYYIKGDPNSAANAIRVQVEVEGGQARYDSVKGFAVDGKAEDIAGIGEKAYLCRMDNAGTRYTMMATLKGNLFVRVMVNTEAYTALTLDPEQLVSNIAAQTLENLFNPARPIPAV